MERLNRSWSAVAGATAAIVALIVAVGLPTLFPALRAGWVRGVLLAAVFAVFLGAAAWRVLRGRRASQAIAGELSSEDPAVEEERALSSRLRDVMLQLRKTSEGRRGYLYTRPWYAIIGPSGTGKTTALVNSGLRFPWSNASLPGSANTRDLDFWFADEAVLIDTAGRYTEQDTGSAADVAGWNTFLKLLRRHRPRQPINGVIVALAVDELLTADVARVDAHAMAIRRRLHELRRGLGVSVPVYLLLTKTDLLAGFAEFFADLDAQGRRAVLGDTFDLGELIDEAALLAGFDRITASLWSRLPKRLHEEADARRRSLLLGFPAQVAALRGRVARLAAGAFAGGPDASLGLRGVYFASGVQDGVVFDRVLSAMADVYDEPQASSGSRGARAFFLNRLLTEVVFAEAGLVRPEQGTVLRRRRRTVAAYLAVALASGSAAVALTGSFFSNRGLQVQLLTRGKAIGAEVRESGVDLQEVRASDPDLEQALPFLDDLRDLPRGYGEGDAAPPLRMRIGLYQAGHADAGREAYLQAAQRVLLPRILLRLEQVLRAGTDSPLELYEPLKAYLMLGGYGPLDKGALRAWVLGDWRDGSLAGVDRDELRARLTRHLDAILADADLGQVWPGGRAPLDGRLIATTRTTLQSLSLADRAYAVLRASIGASGHPDWRVGDVLASGDAPAFRHGDALLATSIPWLFTEDGYVHGYQQELLRVQSKLDRDLWVLGPDASKQSIRSQLSAVRPAVAEAYSRDFIRAWDDLLSSLRPADYFTDRAALGAFTRDPSPLKVLLQEVRRNTALGGGRNSWTSDAGGIIGEHFRQLGDFAGSGGSQSPVDQLVKAVRQAAVANSAAATAGASLSTGLVQGQLATALGELSASGVVAPPQLQPFVGNATRTGQGAADRAARATVDALYAEVRSDCVHSTLDRYPFDRASDVDVSAAEFQSVFGIGGEMDKLMREHLQPLLDTEHAPWRWRGSDQATAGLSPVSAAQLERAAAIRALATGGVSFAVSAGAMTGGVTAVEFSSGGVNHRFEAGATNQAQAIWTSTSLPAAHVKLFQGTREVVRIEKIGPWALFRLMDGGRLQNAGSAAVRATFGVGAQAASLDIRLPTEENPFGRSGPFTFRCPAHL